MLAPHLKRLHRDTEIFRNDVIRGLSAPNRSIPSKYFYDVEGSRLFEKICDLPEYYLTRTEIGIMQQSVSEIALEMGSRIRLVEFGSGSSRKTRWLLDHLDDAAAYVPVDISARHLRDTAEQLRSEYPGLEVTPLVADFTADLELPRQPPDASRTCVYFPGSTIGNFAPPQASELLSSIAGCCREGGGLLIGFDLQKDPSIIEAAYNDQLGVTAEFNKNLLRRVNRLLDGDFRLNQFDHLAFYNQAAGRIEMHLVSCCAQKVRIGEVEFQFEWGETILTEHSHKYSLHGFTELAKTAGWKSRRVWTDERRYFAVMYLDRAQ